MLLWRSIPVVAAMFGVGVAQAQQLHVPQRYPTIQAAVDAARSGARIVVGPGRYYENVSITKPIALVAPAGPVLTVIDGQQLGPVIVAVGTGSEEVRIEGFTLTNGLHTFAMGEGPGPGAGGGIYLDSVNATVRGNVIRGNTACLGTGISTLTASVTIEYNQIIDNRQDPSCSGADGGGIMFRGDGLRASAISSNLIAGHVIGGGGAGIDVQGGERITIEGNVIRDNESFIGGGILMSVASGIVRANVLLRNAAVQGGGMELLPIDNSSRLSVTDNILFGNQATFAGSSIELASVTPTGLVLTGNKVSGDSPIPLINCLLPFDVSPSNVLRNSAGPTTSGFCTSSP